MSYAGSSEAADAPPSPMDVRTLHAGEADLAIRYARSAPREASHETFRDQLSRAPTIFADVP